MAPIPVADLGGEEVELLVELLGGEALVPPRRICEPVKAARPSLPAGSSQLPARTVIAMLTSGSARSSAMKTTMPFFSTTRWSLAAGGWKASGWKIELLGRSGNRLRGDAAGRGARRGAARAATAARGASWRSSLLLARERAQALRGPLQDELEAPASSPAGTWAPSAASGPPSAAASPGPSRPRSASRPGAPWPGPAAAASRARDRRAPRPPCAGRSRPSGSPW